MSPKSSSSFLRQQQEFVADLLREMVNFLHLSSLCQCLALIYVGQLKMESSVPKLSWRKMQHEKGLVCGIYFQIDHGFTQTRFPNSSQLAYHPGIAQPWVLNPDGEMKAFSIWGQLSFLLTFCNGFFYKLAVHLHLVRSSTSLLTTALCFLSKYRRVNILHQARYKQFSASRVPWLWRAFVSEPQLFKICLWCCSNSTPTYQVHNSEMKPNKTQCTKRCCGNQCCRLWGAEQKEDASLVCLLYSGGTCIG